MTQDSEAATIIQKEPDMRRTLTTWEREMRNERMLRATVYVGGVILWGLAVAALMKYLWGGPCA